jgi:methionyl-tRNA formyltransferase
MKSIVFLIARQLGIETLLGTLKDNIYNVKAVFTHFYEPDLITKRDCFSQYVDVCEKYSIPLIIVNKNQKNLELLKSLDFDYLVSNCWKYIVPEEYLHCANDISINMHRSLLPLYKGLKPIRRMLANNEKEGGLTVHEMTKDLDSGRILYQYKIKIEDFDNENSVFQKLYPIQYECMKKGIEFYENNR